RTLADGRLLRLYGSIFALHSMLAALFLVIPLFLLRDSALGGANEWMFYLPVLALGLAFMLPLVIYAEGRGRVKPVALGAVVALGAAALALGFLPASIFALGIVLIVFFAAFTLMEAVLPALVSRLARPDARGTALGFYSTSQFLGIFVGGALGGWLQGHFGPTGLCIFVAALALGWLPLVATLHLPPALASRMLAISVPDAAAAHDLARRFEAVAGVEEALVFADDGVAYLRVDRERLDEAALAGVPTGTDAAPIARDPSR
ncbi:MAG TPA: MFS transporter, partial [Gammaproteobacteria bacterium]|nr:MFS transporter [Gammaproteobacteria bacterium]